MRVVSYTTDAASVTLRDGANGAVTFADREALMAQPRYSNGVRTGRLFTKLEDAECSVGSGTYCDFKVNDAEVYYQWETGANNWNQFAAVKGADGAVRRVRCAAAAGLYGAAGRAVRTVCG